MKKNILCLVMLLLLSVILVGCSNNIGYEENLDNFFTFVHDYENFPSLETHYDTEWEEKQLAEYLTSTYYPDFLDQDFWDISFYMGSLEYNGVEPIKDLEMTIKEATPSGDKNIMDVTAEVSYILVKEDGEYDTKYTFYFDCNTKNGRIDRIHKYARNYENLIE